MVCMKFLWLESEPKMKFGKNLARDGDLAGPSVLGMMFDPSPGLGFVRGVFLKDAFELFRQLETRPMKPTTDRADRQIERLANGFVAKTF